MDTIDFNSELASTLPDRWQSTASGFAITPLMHLGVIQTTGSDAASFLQGQLTQDVLSQPREQARLSAFCQAKGRMLASFLQLRGQEASGEDIIQLIVSRDIAQNVAKRLSMYVLRAKAKVADRSQQLVAFGLMKAQGREIPEAMQTRLPAADMTVSRQNGVSITKVQSAPEVDRWLALVPAEQAPLFWEQGMQCGEAVSPAIWRRLDLQSGVPRIAASTQEKFVPQMVNFELIGGVNFKKGCYPGQEIVARSQYLGKLRRRMFLVHGSGADTPVPGSDVNVKNDAQPVGSVVNVEPDAAGGFHALIEIPHDCLDRGLELAGMPVEVIALPYLIPIESASNA